MKKISLEEAIAKVNDNFSSVFTKEDVISLLSGIKPESKLTPELSEQIQNRIEQCVDRNIDDLVDYDNVSFEINYQNQIEATDVSINIYTLMDYIGSIMSDFVEEPILEEEEVFSSEFTSVEDDVEAELMEFEDEHGGMRNCGDTEVEDDVVELERGTIDNEEADEDSGVTVY